MAKSLFLLIFILQLFSLNLSSQIKGSFDLASTWSINLETLGINSRIYFFIGEKVCLGPEFDYFFLNSKTHHDIKTTKSAIAFDFNVHYLINIVEHRIEAYPILGVNYTQEIETEESFHEIILTQKRAWGLNLGIGIESPINKNVNLFCEFIHTSSTLNDNVIFLGVANKW